MNDCSRDYVVQLHDAGASLETNEGNEKALVVDDNEDVLAVAVELLKWRSGIRCLNRPAAPISSPCNLAYR